MAQYAPEELGFLDKTSKDDHTQSRCCGRWRKGKHAEKKQPFIQGWHTSTEALLTLDGIVAGTVVEGSTTKTVFRQYLESNVMSLFQIHHQLNSWTFFNSYPSALHTQALWVCLWWTMQKSITVMRYLSLLTVLVSCMIIPLDIWWITCTYAGVHLEYLPLYSPD